jgi:hypothetical protein
LLAAAPGADVRIPHDIDEQRRLPHE